MIIGNRSEKKCKAGGLHENIGYKKEKLKNIESFGNIQECTTPARGKDVVIT